ncbi:MAG: hypothetical protein AABZ26_05540, partial [Chloroflexota bacterium]
TELAQEVALTPLAQQDPQALRSPAVLAAMARSMRNRKVIDKLIGLEGPDAERELIRKAGGSFEGHADEMLAGAGAQEPARPTPEIVVPAGIVVPARAASSPQGREAIRALLDEKKEE